MQQSKMQAAAARKLKKGSKAKGGKESFFTKDIHYLGGKTSPSGAGSSVHGSYPTGHGAAVNQGTMRAPRRNNYGANNRG